MRAFKCEVVISISKDGFVINRETKFWVVRANDEESAGKKIFSHFKEYRLLGRCKAISSIHFTEIFINDSTDLEEYLESTEDATICVLF